MPKTAAATTTAQAALPTTTVTNPTNAINQVSVSVTLTFNGVAFNPAALRAALDAAYGTVTDEDDGAGRPMGPFRYRISA